MAIRLYGDCLIELEEFTALLLYSDCYLLELGKKGNK